MSFLFGTILTEEAPASNFHGESESNRTVLQVLPIQGMEHPVISAESMRSSLREILAAFGYPVNRERIRTLTQPAVQFKELHDPTKYADDFLFGYMVVGKGNSKKKKDEEAGESRPIHKRSSVLQMNMAVGLSPHTSNTTFHQSPFVQSPPECQNQKDATLYRREVVHTAFQFPFALNLDDCREGNGPEWTRGLLRALGQLGGVAGNQARALYELSPRSIAIRHTHTTIVAGYPLYGFNQKGEFTPLPRLNHQDLPPGEFWLGGEHVRTLDAKRREELQNQGAHLFENPQRLLEELGKKLFP